MTIPRDFPRFAVEADVEFRADGIEAKGTTSNLSRSGLCANVNRDLAMGSEVELRVRLVFSDDALSEAITLQARVVWSTDMDTHHQIGVSFLALDADTLHDLDIFLRFLEERPE